MRYIMIYPMSKNARKGTTLFFSDLREKEQRVRRMIKSRIGKHKQTGRVVLDILVEETERCEQKEYAQFVAVANILGLEPWTFDEWLENQLKEESSGK